MEKSENLNEKKKTYSWEEEKMELLDVIRQQESREKKLKKRFKLLQETLKRQQEVLTQYQKTLQSYFSDNFEQSGAESLESKGVDNRRNELITHEIYPNSNKRRKIRKPEDMIHFNNATDRNYLQNPETREMKSTVSSFIDLTEDEPLIRENDTESRPKAETVSEISSDDSEMSPSLISMNALPKEHAYPAIPSLNMNEGNNLANRCDTKNFNQKSKSPKDKSKDSTHAFVEVVRDRNKRIALPAHDCNDCVNYYDAVKNALPNGKSGTLKQCSRHRAAFEPYHTPDGFWNLSFPDSV